jgi:hypothetical protein
MITQIVVTSTLATMKKKTLVEVKTELAAKYRHLASLTKSKPRQKIWLNKARGYAQQVAKLS